MATEKAKSCPECGTINKLTAKVCIQCGHRFQTQFNAPAQQSSPRSKPTTKPQEEHPDSTSAISPPVDPLEGSPAPDVSSEDLDELREESPEHSDAYERLKRSLRRKDRKP